MALLRQQSDDGVAQGMTEPEVGFRALQEARMHLKKTEGIYTEEHPNVQHLRAEVARLEQELEETPESTDQSPVVGPLARSLRLQIESANLDLDARKRRETQIFQEIERLQERVDETPRREQELVGLTRDYNNLTETYRTLLGKKYEAAIARNLEQAQKGERFRLLRPAQVPPHPTWPDPRILIPAGLAVGLAITGLLIVVSEIRHPAFRSVERLKRMIGLPVFASIPEIDNDAIYEVPPNGEVDPKLVVFTAPESAPAEQYRGFIPTLLDSEGCQVILVTSAARGDGKTLTCMNIAVSLATDLDKRVLVIDSDLRRPSVHRVVRVSRKKGLSNILNGESTLEECAVNSKISNLSVLPAGPTVRNPLALMTGESFLELLADARKRYDLILIDSPPLLPVVDTRILRKMSDMLLFVVRADSTPRDAVVRSLRDMRDVAGIVFNGVSPGAFRRHYYYDAYSTYAYGDAPADAEDSVDG
jgi:capsular exopolysaccharide synthesis family protein